MANTLIDELIINIKQRGAVATSRAIKKVADNLEDAAAGVTLVQEELDKLPAMLREVENRAAAVSTAFGNMPSSFGGHAILNALERIAENTEHTHNEVLGLNEAFENTAINSASAMDTLANSITGDLESVQDSIIDTTTATNNLHTALSNLPAHPVPQAPGGGAPSGGAPSGAPINPAGSNNAIRNFAAMARVAGPLPLLYAQIAANVFALTEAWAALAEGEQINRVEDSGTTLGSKVGIPIQTVARDMQELTGNTLGYAEALRQAAAVSAYGFNPEQINQLTLAARRASIALGVEMTDALNRVVRGTSKLEIELLDELGITTKLTTAYKNYAQQLGVSADSLNAFQQRSALVAEINAQSVEKFGELDELLKGMPWERFGANARTALDETLAGISRATTGFAEFINKQFDASTAAKAATKEIADTYTTLQKAQEIGNVGGTLGATVQFIALSKELLETRKELNAELIKEQAAYAALKQSDTTKFFKVPQSLVDITTKVENLNAAMLTLPDSIPTAKTLGVPNLKAAAEAYAGITSAVKGSVADFKTSLSLIEGSQTAQAKLALSIKQTSEAYYELKRTNPNATAAELTKQLKVLGFTTEQSLDATKRTAELYASATDQLDRYTLTIAEYQKNTTLATVVQGKSIVLLRNQIILQDEQLRTAEKLGSSEVSLDRLRLTRLTTVTALQSAETDLNTTIHDRLRIQSELQAAQGNAGPIAAMQEEVRIAGMQLEAQKGIVGTQQQQLVLADALMTKTAELAALEDARARSQADSYLVNLQSTTGMNPEEKQDAAMQQRASMFNSSLNNITSQVDGLGAMTSAFTDLSLAATGFGDASTSALQLTSIGLNGFAGMLKMTSQASIGAIDAQIQQEQKRDGKSKESLAKIKALEAKKIEEQKKAAQKQILMSTAVAVMNAAANPWPVPALPLMAAAAAAGGIAYSQASSAASNKMATLNTQPNIPTASVSLGKRSNDIDVSKSANAGELAFARGQQGTGGAQNFTPRANAGGMSANQSFIAGENGPEIVTPVNPMKAYSAEESSKAGSNDKQQIVFSPNIQAMDAQSIIDRSDEIFDAFVHSAEQRGMNVNNLR